MSELPHEFTERMARQLGAEYNDFKQSYNLPPRRAIRVNTLKISAENFKKVTPFALSPTPWEPSGFFVEGESLGKTVLHAAGAYYVQEPSAMAVVPQLEVKEGERVLDLCAAPGGKGTQIAQYMRGRGVLVLNEPVASRRDILAQNVERLGIKNAVITCAEPDILAGGFQNYFDKILVDAPCSGEGMFKKEPKAILEWSLQNVKMCAARQRGILEAAHSMLCGGGRLVYSTCTFSPEEDEQQVENFLSLHKSYKLLDMKKLLPHEILGEGHFYAVLEKQEGERAEDFPLIKPSVPKKTELGPYREWEAETLRRPVENLVAEGGSLFTFYGGAQDFSCAVPEKERWRFRSLIPLGNIGEKRSPFVPAHAFATRLTTEEANFLQVDGQTALKFLRGLTFDCAADLKGWYLVTYENLPLGWCKAVNGTAKNHLPKALRI